MNFVDPFVRKGYRFAGTAAVVERGEPGFDELARPFPRRLAPACVRIVKITVTKALPLMSPAYDRGTSEPELRRIVDGRFRKLQPNERFEEASDDGGSAGSKRGTEL